MRLQRLDLTRYGKFTDHTMDFGDKPTDRPDLHIVYGPNEAGKSTALSAFLDLLFGIETRSRFNFIHPHPAMRVGALLDLGDGVRTFARIKRPQNSLLDVYDQPVSDVVFQGRLGGIDRDAYRMMFSLDDETLEAGGESILASKGDLGQLLFSASAGLSDLSQGLNDLKAEADRFYKFRARSGELPDLKARLADLKTERERIDTLASDYARLIEARHTAEALYDEAIAERSRVAARMEEVRRYLGALPRLAALRTLRARLEPFTDLPEAPRHWAADLPLLVKEEIELGVTLAALDTDIAQSAARLDGIAGDAVALRQTDGIAGLADSRARHTTAEKDLPERRSRLRETEGAIAALLRRIERENEAEPRRLVLGASATGRLRELMEARSGVDAAVTSAAGELASARRRLEEARSTLKAAEGAAMAPGRDAAMAALSATVLSLRTRDFTVRGRLAESALDAARGRLAERLRVLRPWTGEVDELADLEVPNADRLARWTAAIADAEKRLERHADETERMTTERGRLEAERDAIGATTGIVADADAAAVRASRDRAWSDHRQKLDGSTAETFEAALRRDDAVTTGRFGHMADLAKLHQASQALAVTMAEGQRAAELRDAAAASLRSVHEVVAATASACSPALKGLDLPRFEAWLARRDAALEAGEQNRVAEQALREARGEAEAALKSLGGALAGIGLAAEPGAGFETVMELAQAALDREAALKALRLAHEERRRDLATRTQDAEVAAAGEARWSADWAAACAACWLGQSGVIPTRATVREILPALTELGALLKERGGLADRVDKMEKDQAAFRAAIFAIADEMGIDVAARPVGELAQAIDRRVADARADAVRRAAEVAKLEAARERHRALQAAIEIHRRRAAEMTRFFGVETLPEVGRKMQDAETRTELRRQAEEAQRDILDALRRPTLGEAEQALDAADRAVLEAEFATLEQSFADLDQRRLDLFSRREKAVDQVQAIGGDARVAEIEERRRTTLLEIEEGALRYLKRRAGTLATEQALRAYRDRHRSSMMGRASEAFSTISRGAYSGLSAQPRDGGETLIALQAGGGSKEAVALSKGTRFQLYLALRVAGYHEFARSRPPVPFIADDIMETFDDFRAEEAFRLFADMAKVGQVIYLTHHRHLCDIARAACPGVTVHTLGG